MKKISIITVTYNCSNVLEKTILSVINQDYINIEYIIIDGGSNDGTLDIINKYSDKISYWTSEKDNGIYDAMNKGIMAATGDYVNFMNAGDSFYSNSVISEFAPKIENDAVIAHGDIMRLFRNYRYRDCPPPIEKASEMMPAFHQAAFTLRTYHRSNLFNLKYSSASDYDFFYHAHYTNHVKFQYIPILVANFDCCDGTSNVNFKQSLRERYKINGKDGNWINKIKIELWLILIEFKRKILNKFLPESMQRNREFSKLKSRGKNIEII